MPYRIVALRHAEPTSDGYADDSLRPLSEVGRRNQKKLTKMLQYKGIIPTLILTSPLLRALETAGIVGAAFNVEIQEEPALGDQFNTNKLLKVIASSENHTTIFLVGHAPTLGSFISDLVGENVIPQGLSKSSAAIVEFESNIELGAGKLTDYIKA